MTTERDFLQLLQHILSQPDRKDRTGTGTRSVFSPPEMRFSLENNTFPLLTTRKLSLRLIFEELMWFLRGQTNVSILREKGVHVWNGNTSRAFLDQRGLTHYEEGDLGPSYSFQFRHFGAEYNNCKTDYTGQGFDQLQYVINEIKQNPFSRRLIINLWNANDLDKMSLQPCGFCYQFYVDETQTYLSCKLTQRSSDIALAGGWNIASASLLTYMIAHVCGLKPKELIWSLGDTHIYLNQIEAVKEQLKQTPASFPTLHIVQSPEKNEITNFEFNHFKLEDYNPSKPIKIQMNV
jgi:thymidylate synthase